MAKLELDSILLKKINSKILLNPTFLKYYGDYFKNRLNEIFKHNSQSKLSFTVEKCGLCQYVSHLSTIEQGGSTLSKTCYDSMAMFHYVNEIDNMNESNNSQVNFTQEYYEKMITLCYREKIGFIIQNDKVISFLEISRFDIRGKNYGNEDQFTVEEFVNDNNFDCISRTAICNPWTALEYIIINGKVYIQIQNFLNPMEDRYNNIVNIKYLICDLENIKKYTFKDLDKKINNCEKVECLSDIAEEDRKEFELKRKLFNI